MSGADAALPLDGDRSAGSPESALAAEYRQLMRWYPHRWRRDNEDAMLGALLDQAEDEGREHPTDAERTALVRSGLAQWFGFPVPGQRLRLIPLIVGGALSVFYATVVIWSPQTNYPGSIGPFSNPSIITCVLLSLALVIGLFTRARVADVLALAAAAVEIVIGVLAAFHPTLGPEPWQGPSPSTAALFAGIAILSSVTLGRGWASAAGALLVVAGTASMMVVNFVQAELGMFSVLSTILVAVIVAAVVGAIAISIRHRRISKRSV